MEKTTIGILGLGSRTTTFYVSQLNKLFNLEFGGYSTCPFILLNTNFDKINALLPLPSEKLATIVKQCITAIEKQNIEQILIPNITLHETIDRIPVLKKIIHPVFETIARLKQHKIKKTVLFGSAYSMKSNYLKKIFSENDIEIVIPSERDRLLIDEVRKHVYSGTETKALLDEYNSILDKYLESLAVVIACTELSIISVQNDNLFDMAHIQIAKALQLIKE